MRYILIGGGSATIQKRKGRGHRKQEGTEGGGSANIGDYTEGGGAGGGGGGGEEGEEGPYR